MSPPIKFLQRIELRLKDDDDAEDHKMLCESVEVFDYSTNKSTSFFVSSEITRNAQKFPKSMQTGGLTEGMDMLNMQAAGKKEKVLLFGFINLFTCTDRNLCTPPTSKAAIVLSFLRILESGVVCAVFVPVVCSLTDGCGEERDESDDVLSVDRVSSFEIKSFLAVYLSVCSFACLLAGSAAEKLAEYNERKAHDQKISWPSAIGKVMRINRIARQEEMEFQLAAKKVAGGGDSLAEDKGTLSRCMRKGREAAGSCKHWKSNVTFLYLLAPLLLVVMLLCGVTLYYVYVSWMTECRSVVLISLVVAFGMIVICVRLALGKEQVWLVTDDAESEVRVLVTLLAVICVGALVLGATDTDVSIGDLSDGPRFPFEFLASRCHSGDAWRSWRS